MILETLKKDSTPIKTVTLLIRCGHNTEYPYAVYASDRLARRGAKGESKKNWRTEIIRGVRIGPFLFERNTEVDSWQIHLVCGWERYTPEKLRGILPKSFEPPKSHENGEWFDTYFLNLEEPDRQAILRYMKSKTSKCFDLIPITGCMDLYDQD